MVKILGGPKHTLAHPLKFLGGHGPPPSSATPVIDGVPLVRGRFYLLSLKHIYQPVSMCIRAVLHKPTASERVYFSKDESSDRQLQRLISFI